MTKPLKPSEVVSSKKFPEFVIGAFNAEIAKNFLNGRATVKQCDVVARISALGYSSREIYDNKWLDIEDTYRAEGWAVSYDKPGYNETYEAYFIFAQTH